MKSWPGPGHGRDSAHFPLPYAAGGLKCRHAYRHDSPRSQPASLGLARGLVKSQPARPRRP